MNITDQAVAEHVASALARGIPLRPAPAEPHDRTAAVVGFGPTLEDTWETIEGDVFAINNAADWLIDRGVEVHCHVIADGQSDIAKCIREPRDDVIYLIASQSHPSVLDKLEGYPVVLWHGWHPVTARIVKEFEQDAILVMGGYATGERTVQLAGVFGYRKVNLYGLDLCLKDFQHHAGRQKFGSGDECAPEMREINGKRFWTVGWMRGIADELPRTIEHWKTGGMDVTFHGDSYATEIWRQNGSASC